MWRAASENLLISMSHLRLLRLTFCLALILAGVDPALQSQEDQRRAAFSLEQQGRNAEAEQAWLSISKLQPSNPEAYAHIGLLEARSEHYPEAIRYYRKAYALAPAMTGLRLNLGLALFKNGNYKQAAAMFEPLLKAHPDDRQLTILVGMSHYGQGQFAAASPYLELAAKGDPQNLPLLLTLAHSCLYSNQFQCVLDTFHQIMALNAESAEADMLVGEALDEMKDRVGAIREFRAAVQADPREPNVHFGLGYLLWTNGQYGEAAGQFQAEIDNAPQHLQATLYLADSEMQLNQLNSAEPLLERLVKRSPSNAMAHRDLGIVYAEQDRKQDALAEFQAAIRLAPKDANAHWRLGRLYRSMGKAAEAKAEFDKTQNLNKAEDEHLLKVMSSIPGSERKSTPAPQK